MKRRSFLALSLLVAAAACSRGAINPEAFAKSRMTLNASTVPSGVLVGLTQSVPPSPPSFNYNEFSQNNDSYVETKNKYAASKPRGTVSVTCENQSQSTVSFTLKVNASAFASAAYGGNALASAALGGAVLPAVFVSGANGFGSHSASAVFETVVSLDPGQVKAYSGSNYIETEVPISAPGGGGG
jgi:hypothetical protein